VTGDEERSDKVSIFLLFALFALIDWNSLHSFVVIAAIPYASMLSRTVAQVLPLFSLAISKGESLVVGGSALTAYESHILFWRVQRVAFGTSLA
jgi:hypothetical protein